MVLALLEDTSKIHSPVLILRQLKNLLHLANNTKNPKSDRNYSAQCEYVGRLGDISASLRFMISVKWPIYSDVKYIQRPNINVLSSACFLYMIL